MTTLDHAPPHLDPDSVFDRDKFLLRQKLVAISQKYSVSDESGRDLLYIERPAFAFRGALLLFLTLFLFIASIVLAFILAETLFPTVRGHAPAAQPIAFLLLLLLGTAGSVALAVALYPKRHIYFYLDKDKQHQLLSIRQGTKWELFRATYTVIGREGDTLAIFKKNYLWNLIRRRWRILDPEGNHIATALEDSAIKSLIRRLLGTYAALIRTNFNILSPAGDVLGAFNRKRTILDKYILDMTPDTQVALDRRVALALGVMLDTGERR
jgi:uncharacterized protein YxjI